MSSSTFHFEGRHHRLYRGDDEAADIMLCQTDNRSTTSTSTNTCSTFSDWSFYQQLQQQDKNVELSQLHVEHTSWFLTSIQATYQCTYYDGEGDGRPTTSRTVELDAPKHDFQRFRRQYPHYQHQQNELMMMIMHDDDDEQEQHHHDHRQQRTIHNQKSPMRSTLKLQLDQGEYITNLSFRTVDKISDRITIRTNLRQVSFGSPDISGYPPSFLLTNNDNSSSSSLLPRKVVALAGVTSEMSEQMGCFSESQHWNRLKEWILMRALVEQHRAVPIPLPIPSINHNHDDDDNNDIAVIMMMDVVQSLILKTNDDIFKRVLSFLIPPLDNDHDHDDSSLHYK